MITREEALAFLSEHVKNKNLVKHCLASEAVMRALARRFGEGEEPWGLAGLLHDADVEISPAELQGVMVGDMLADTISPEMRHAMASHNPKTGVSPASRMDYALMAGETVTGLIVAAALIIPEKKLAALAPDGVERRFHEKRFAAGADRALILKCEELGMSLKEFIELALLAMQGISSDLGL